MEDETLTEEEKEQKIAELKQAQQHDSEKIHQHLTEMFAQAESGEGEGGELNFDLDVSALDLTSGGNMFDNIMNKFVDRNAFSRQAKFAGGHDTKRRRSSIMRDAHMGNDATEDERVRRKQSIIEHYIESHGGEKIGEGGGGGENRNDGGKEGRGEGQIEIKGDEQNEGEEEDDEFGSIMENLGNKQGGIETTAAPPADDISELSIREEGSIESIASLGSNEKRAKLLADEQFAEELRVETEEKEQKKILETEMQEVQVQLKKKAIEAYNEAIEKKNQQMIEKAKKKHDAAVLLVKEQKKAIEDVVEYER